MLIILDGDYMLIFKTPIALALICVMLIIHVLSSILRDRISKILNYVNLCLHILLILPLILGGVPIDEAVMLYMLSVLVYTLTRFISGSIRGMGGKR